MSHHDTQMTPAPEESKHALQATITALQARRSLLGDALVDAALAPLLERLASLNAPPKPAEPERLLRQVSVLFLDIVGSTQLIEHLDPEDVQLVMDGALAAFTTIVKHHGGEVLRYAGDSIKAAFGASGTREDDAERAVHCGLALLQEAARRGEALQRQQGHAGFGARVGIHTGAVVCGGGIEQDNSLSGLAVNIAARMEQAAPAGKLRISVDTCRQVQHVFEVQEQPALLVKGLREPMRTFIVLSVRARRLHGLRQGLDGAATPLAGRAAELDLLRSMQAAVFAPGAPLAAATLTGEAGLGKSRLLAEFQSGLPVQQGALALWRASSHPLGLHQPCGLLRDLLYWHHSVQDSDTQAQAQHKLAAALAPIFGAAADEQTAMLGQLIGLDYSSSPFVAGILHDGKQLRARGFHAWAEYLRLQASRQPLVLVLDDLQWADDESLSAIDHLVGVGASWPIVLLCAARPELLQRRPDWGAAWPVHQRLTLAPLADDARSTLATSLLQRLAQPSPALQTLLTQQAAGNPYYMEALLQMLVDRGVITLHGAQWQVQPDRLQGLPVPSTLVGVLQATLDALTPGQRQSLQQASVLGVQFCDHALAAINPLAPAELPALQQRELALPQAQSAFEGTQDYAFRHQLLHQVTYATVLKPDKRDGHQRAALWLQARSGGREVEMASQIAEHFERAGDNAQALACWLRAAEDAARRQADSAALAHADRGLALDDGTDLARQVRLRRVRTAVLLRAGEIEQHGDELARLEALADQLDDDSLRLALGTDAVWRLYLATRFVDAVVLGEQRLARAQGRSPADAARVHNILFIALSRLGRFDEAVVHAHQGLEQAHTAGDHNTEGAIHNNLGVNHLDAYRTVLAQDHFSRALDAYTAAGSRYGICTVQVNLAQLEDRQCRPDRSRDMLLRTLQVCQDIGHRTLAALVQANLSVSLQALGDLHGALAAARDGLALAQRTGDRFTQAEAHAGAFVPAFALGHWPEALRHAQAAQAIFADCGQRERAWDQACAAAYTLCTMGEPTQAQAAAEAVLAEVADAGGWGECIDAPFHLHRTLKQLGDARADALLAVAWRGLDTLALHHAEFVPRDTFLHATALRRALVQAWTASAEQRGAGM